MEIQIKSKGCFKQVKVLHNRLDTFFIDKLKQTLFVLVDQLGNKNIILDISNCSYCDASGLGAIVLGSRLCEKETGRFILTGTHDYVEQLIKICKLDTVFPIVKKAEDIDKLFYSNVN